MHDYPKVNFGLVGVTFIRTRFKNGKRLAGVDDYPSSDGLHSTIVAPNRLEHVTVSL